MSILATLLLAAVPSAVDSAPHGLYIEGRSATVFAGACHYGAEYGSRGREAVLGFSFDGGVHDGQSFEGLDLVCVVSADRNLGEAPAERRSTLYLPRSATPAQRAALVDWLRDNHADVVGSILAQRTLDVSVDRSEAGLRITAGEFAQLEAAALPGDMCCTMPFKVWYEPLVPARERRVGTASSFRAADPVAQATFRITEENCVFYGAF